MHITYRPQGVCSQLFEIDVENGIIEKVEVKGGCSGNLQGISRLLVGMKAEEAAASSAEDKAAAEKAAEEAKAAKAAK